MPPTDPTKAKFGAARRAASDGPADHPAAAAAGQASDNSADDEAGATSLETEPDTARTLGDGPSRNGRPSDGHGGAKSDAAGRGKLVMAAKVVEKIAAQAASEVSAAGGTSGGVFGIGAKADLSARPNVDVHLSGRTATVDVAVAVAYPTSIRKATDRVRRHIIDRVGALAGVQVTRVDIDVTAFHPTNDTPREGLR